MITGLVLFVLTIPVPLLFVVGFYSGKRHIRHLAKQGGEEVYPDAVQRVVRKYRREQLRGKPVGQNDA